MATVDRLVGWLAPSASGEPRYQALASGLRGLILDGRLIPGVRLPAERELATGLAVSRSTVTAAYDRLRDEGFVHSRRRAGTVVTVPVGSSARPDELAPATGDEIDLTVAALPAPAVLPEVIGDAMQRLPPVLNGHGLHPLGLTALRVAVAERFGARGLPTMADQILITQGALHGWDLMLRALTRPGDRVVVEQPTYPGVIDAASAHHVRIRPLPVSTEGWDLDQTRQSGHAPAVLVHATPDGQNPTGWCAPPRARRELIGSLDPTTVLVVDETFAELYLNGERPRPTASYGRSERVVTVGSMSKPFWAGLRVGWLRGSASMVRRIATVRGGQDLATPVLDQLVAAELLERYASILSDRAIQITRNRDALLDSIARRTPGWSASRPECGLALWVDLGATSSTRLALLARDAGVRIIPGPRFTVRGASHDRWLRVPFALPAARAEEALDRLVGALDSADASAGVGSPLSWTA